MTLHPFAFLRKHVRLKLRNMGLYSFSVVILYLAASYFGGFFFSLFFFSLALPFVSLLHTLIAQAGLVHDQKLNVEYPIKGQSLDYHLYLYNRGLLPIARVKVRFKTFRPELNAHLEDFSCYLGADSVIEKTFSLSFEFRGTYNVGLERLEVEDAFGFLSINKRVSYRTIYIYPRISRLKSFHPSNDGYRGFSAGRSRNGDPDYSLFTQLNEYRSGESIRHIYWKKFVNQGLAYIKEFEQVSTHTANIYIDTRSYSDGARKALYVEDTSVEILVSLVKFLLDSRIHTQVNAPGAETYRFEGSNPIQFEGFYRSTSRICFQDTISPTALYRADTARLFDVRDTLILITHRPDHSVVTLLEELRRKNQKAILIVNNIGMTEREISRIKSYFEDLRRRGGGVLHVRGAETITEDLER